METEEKYSVHKGKALDHAIVRMLFGVITKVPKLEGWKGATIMPEPLEIYDLNGQLLFYEFSVERAGKIVGRIKASASKVLGPGVYTTEIGPRLWDPEKAAEQSRKKAQKEYEGAKILSTRLVCYSYPKIGALVTLADPKVKEEVRFLVDVATYEPVSLVMPEENRLGVGVWSMYASIPQKDRPRRVLLWEQDDKFVELVKSQAEKSKIDMRTKLSDKELQTLGNALKKTLSRQTLLKKGQKTIRGATKIGVLVWPSKVIPLALYGQEDPDWCACATGQMILRYHHYYYEQNDIAVAMGTIPPAPSPPPFYPSGTTYGGFMGGMESLSRNYLKAVQSVDPPIWTATENEINQDRPLMSCIPFHARACAGYWESPIIRYVLVNGIIYRRRVKFVYIYDPWPPNANNAFCNSQGGAEYWEDWDATGYWPFVYLQP